MLFLPDGFGTRMMRSRPSGSESSLSLSLHHCSGLYPRVHSRCLSPASLFAAVIKIILAIKFLRLFHRSKIFWLRFRHFPKGETPVSILYSGGSLQRYFRMNGISGRKKGLQLFGE